MGETRQDIKEREVRRPQGWSEGERLVAFALRDERADPTGVCLDPDELLALIETGNDGEAAERKVRHMVACAFCRHEYRQLRKALRLSEILTPDGRGDPEAAAPGIAQTGALPGRNGSHPVPSFRTRFVRHTGVALAAALVLAAIVVVPLAYQGKKPAHSGSAPPNLASVQAVPSSWQPTILVKNITRAPAEEGLEGDLTVKCLLLNPSPAPAYHVRVLGADLGPETAKEGVKVDLGDVSPGGASAVFTVAFPHATGLSGEKKRMTINGTVSGKTFQGTNVIALP